MAWLAQLAQLEGGRGVYAGLFAAAFVLMAFDQAGHSIARDARGLATDLTLPVMEAVSGAVGLTRTVVETTRDYTDLAARYERLRAENSELRHAREAAHALEARARGYEQLLAYEPDDGLRTIAARAVTDIESPFARSLVITAGRERGVMNGNAVLGEGGFIGRVVSTGQKSARVLLITDLKSRIPVFVGERKHRAILVGTNRSGPTLMHLAASAVLAPGDPVVTSGEDRMLPSGLTIGLIAVDEDGQTGVAMTAVPDDVERVRIVLSTPQIDIDATTTPLPLVLMDNAERASMQPAPAQTGAIRAAIAIEAAPQPVPAE